MGSVVSPHPPSPATKKKDTLKSCYLGIWLILEKGSLQMSLSWDESIWIRVDSKQISSVLRRKEKFVQRLRENCRGRQRWDRCCQKPGTRRMSRSHQKLEGRHGIVSPSDHSRRCWPCRHLDFKLLASKENPFYCWKPPVRSPGRSYGREPGLGLSGSAGACGLGLLLSKKCIVARGVYPGSHYVCEALCLFSA